MESVADTLRREEHESLLGLGAAERVALALRLGARDLDAFRRASDPPRGRDDAVRELERRRQAGRRPSVCAASIIECSSGA